MRVLRSLRRVRRSCFCWRVWRAAWRMRPAAHVAVLYRRRTPLSAIFADVLDGIERGLTVETVRVRALSEAPEGRPARWLDQQAPASHHLGRVPTETYERIGRTYRTSSRVGCFPANPPERRGVGLAVDPALLFATLQRLSPATRRFGGVRSATTVVDRFAQPPPPRCTFSGAVEATICARPPAISYILRPPNGHGCPLAGGHTRWSIRNDLPLLVEQG